jgi:hypothetical protein
MSGRRFEMLVQEQAAREEDNDEDLERLTDSELRQLQCLLEKARGIETDAEAIEATVDTNDLQAPDPHEMEEDGDV